MAAVFVEKSEENWNIFEQLRSSNFFDAAASRLYYSLFQAVKAFALKTGTMTEDDSLNVHVKAKDIVRQNCSSSIYHAFCDALEMRVRADYESRRVLASEFSQHFICQLDMLRRQFVKLAS